MYNERKNKCDGMMDILWETGGVSCEVFESGVINVGDHITFIDVDELKNMTPNDVPQCPNIGGKEKEFFIRPKQRTAAMVRTLLEGKKKKKEELSKTDPEGLLRLQKSFESVGLKY